MGQTTSERFIPYQSGSNSRRIVQYPMAIPPAVIVRISETNA